MGILDRLEEWRRLRAIDRARRELEAKHVDARETRLVLDALEATQRAKKAQVPTKDAK